MAHRYTYILLKHQASLEPSSKESDSFAVLVEGQGANGWVVFAVGRYLKHSAQISPVGAAISQQIPDILTHLLLEASRAKEASETVLDHLTQLMTWNFHASNPQVIEDDDSIERVGYKLFAHHVAHASELMKRVGPNTGPIQETLSGDTFTAAVPVPDPTPELFATVP
jgi:hypothetical protein